MEHEQNQTYTGLPLWKINIDPENHKFLEETNLSTPIWQGLC